MVIKFKRLGVFSMREIRKVYVRFLINKTFEIDRMECLKDWREKKHFMKYFFGINVFSIETFKGVLFFCKMVSFLPFIFFNFMFTCLNPLRPGVAFLYPLSGYRKATAGCNGLKESKDS